MALLHQATLTPTKRDLMAEWLPGRSWAAGRTLDAVLAAYRFEDPAGEVGLETHLLRADDGALLQVPLTYRSAPLPGADEHLVGTTEHSVLGSRWVYDGCADPVWVAALLSVLLGGAGQAEEYFEVDGERRFREPTAVVRGSGESGFSVPQVGSVAVRDADGVTVVAVAGLRVGVARVVGTPLAGSPTLTGGPVGAEPAVLAAVLR